jgi:ABC-type transport system involved in multi-copper enzyme maturation permease subunit
MSMWTPGAVRDWARLVYLSARLIAGRWWWAVPLIPLLWTAYLILAQVFEWGDNGDYAPYNAQNMLIAVPLSMLAIGLGVRIIAAELDSRTLEIAYTVPGGTRRVWTAKLIAAALMLAAAELLLAGAALVLTSYPVGVLYTAFQAAVFYLVLSMALSALFKSEVTGALVSVPAWIFGLMLWSVRPSPFFNTLVPQIADRTDPSDILAWTIQNRVGYAIVILAIVALAFGRAERREQMMSG